MTRIDQPAGSAPKELLQTWGKPLESLAGVSPGDEIDPKEYAKRK